ncbi:hypothetical protein AYO21_06707 [Fonsecaea monophora]|uniref:Uncharacterized protein n=1 Tax=Fonsecaea monophora TaxID=254056 RepID=A0A177F3S4_9EURO|nr:hypothetical protein AYO21_06707 [Fonsecaea monophora]KAH0829812.1 hypothetical protein FOPE_10487 [Fonsecaea pedrosoi]OAG38987.1 hypothetical protein AYO21_06707 [Fonsecaea monophora]
MATRELHLAVFSGDSHGILAFIASPRTGLSFLDDAEPDYGFDYEGDNPDITQTIVEASLPRPIFPVRTSPPLREVEERIRAMNMRHCRHLTCVQNLFARSTLAEQPCADLRALRIYMWDLASPRLVKMLATQFPDLEELQLGFCHPYIHDPCLPLKFWVRPEFLVSSAIWDIFGGVGQVQPANLRLTRLKKLTLQRSGINRVQLQKWIECNPGLVDLRMHHVAGVDATFVQWLGRYYGPSTGDHADPGAAAPAKLTTLALESCTSLHLETLDDLAWLDSFFPARARAPVTTDQDDKPRAPAFNILSFRDSTRVSSSALMAYLALKRPAVRQVTFPDGRVLVETTTDPGNDGDIGPELCSSRAYSTTLACDDTQPSPVPYLRFRRFSRRFPRRLAGTGDDIIEPDSHVA